MYKCVRRPANIYATEVSSPLDSFAFPSCRFFSSLISSPRLTISRSSSSLGPTTLTRSYSPASRSRLYDSPIVSKSDSRWDRASRRATKLDLRSVQQGRHKSVPVMHLHPRVSSLESVGTIGT